MVNNFAIPASRKQELRVAARIEACTLLAALITAPLPLRIATSYSGERHIYQEELYAILKRFKRHYRLD